MEPLMRKQPIHSGNSHNSRKSRARGFTITELCAAVVASGLLALVIMPALASSKTDSERVVCFNNLRVIGRGVNEFSVTHDGRVPWRTPVFSGGTMQFPKVGNAYEEFAFLSNAL